MLKMLVKPQTATAVLEPETQPQTVLVEAELTAATELLTQEYLGLWVKLEAIEGKQIIKRLEEIRKALVAVANETMDGTKPAIFACADGELEFSERGTETVIPDVEVLIKYLIKKHGSDAAMSVIDIRLGELRKVLHAVELAPFIKEQDGSRTLKSVRPLTTTGI